MPRPKDEATRDRLRSQRRRDTAPEMAVRRELHRRGLRYRVDRKPLMSMRSRADIVFGPTRVAVFVDGCFWHGCPAHASLPKNNRVWWQTKLERNVERDRRVDGELAEAGWAVIRAWEHDDPVEVADEIERIVDSRRGTSP